MDINFLVKRESFTDKRTLGRMYVDGEYICDTLEDKDRKLETTGARNITSWNFQRTPRITVLCALGRNYPY